MTSTMRAMVADTPGAPSVLQLKTVAVPTPGDGQALMRVAYVGMNPLDAMARDGKIDFLPITWPFIAGLEKAGIITAVGTGVDASLIGQRVIARSEFGGYGEYALVKAKLLLKLDPRIDLKTGCVYRGCSFTAWHGLYKAGHLQKAKPCWCIRPPGPSASWRSKSQKMQAAQWLGFAVGLRKWPMPNPLARTMCSIICNPIGLTTQRRPRKAKASMSSLMATVGPMQKNIGLAAPLGRVVYIGATAGSYPAPVQSRR